MEYIYINISNFIILISKPKSLFDINGVVRHELLPPGQYVNGHFYVQVLQRLRDAVRKKRRDNRQGEWFLYNDNAPSHKSLVLQQFLAEKSIPVTTQPPYSPDLAQSDFWLFPTLKIGLNGTRFVTMEHIKLPNIQATPVTS